MWDPKDVAEHDRQLERARFKSSAREARAAAFAAAEVDVNDEEDVDEDLVVHGDRSEGVEEIPHDG